MSSETVHMYPQVPQTYPNVQQSAQQPVRVNLSQAANMMNEISRLEQAYNTAIGENLKLQENMRNRFGKNAPLTFQAERITPYAPNMQLSFADMITEMNSRREELKGKINVVAKSNVEINDEIKKLEKIGQYIHRLNQQVPNHEVPRQEYVRADFSVRHHPSNPFKSLANVAFWAIPVFDVLHGGSGIGGLIGGYCAYKLLSNIPLPEVEFQRG